MAYRLLCSMGSSGRLNMSNMRCVMVKPPPMLTADASTASAARPYAQHIYIRPANAAAQNTCQR